MCLNCKSEFSDTNPILSSEFAGEDDDGIKDISSLIRESYGGKLKVYKTDIPRSVRAEEISAEGKSIFKHDPKGKVADAYRVLTKEVLNNAEKRRKHQLEGIR